MGIFIWNTTSLHQKINVIHLSVSSRLRGPYKGARVRGVLMVKIMNKCILSILVYHLYLDLLLGKLVFYIDRKVNFVRKDGLDMVGVGRGCILGQRQSFGWAVSLLVKCCVYKILPQFSSHLYETCYTWSLWHVFVLDVWPIFSPNQEDLFLKIWISISWRHPI